MVLGRSTHFRLQDTKDVDRATPPKVDETSRFNKSVKPIYQPKARFHRRWLRCTKPSPAAITFLLKIPSWSNVVDRKRSGLLLLCIKWFVKSTRDIYRNTVGNEQHHGALSQPPWHPEQYIYHVNCLPRPTVEISSWPTHETYQKQTTPAAVSVHPMFPRLPT